MKIGFDISMLVYVGSGVATYTYNLVKNLLLIDKKNEYHLFYSSLRRPKNFYYLDKLKELGAKIHSCHFPPRLMKLWWGKWHIVPIELFTGKMDYFHTSDFLRPPLLKGTKGITTVHDLTWKLFPRWHTEEVVKAHKRKLAKTIKYGDIIVCPSQNTKKDLLKFYPQAKKNNKIFVIPEGVDERFKSIKDKKLINKVLKKYKIKQPYLVYVGAIEPRKNLKRLIRAFDLLLKTHHSLSLVIGGRAGWKNQDIFQLVKDLALEKKVIFTGFIEDQDLPIIYSVAECCCYVSLYEGFGLPPLEAQACGCPVVASNVASLPEVLGDSAILVNPKNESKIKEGILAVLLKKSGDKISDNYQKFTWQKTAESFLNVIHTRN